MKKALLLLLLLVLAGLAFPLSNLHGPDAAQQKNLSRISDPTFRKTAHLFQTRCLDCHSSQTRLPFYADFPIARDLIRQDIATGTAAFNLDGKLEGRGRLFTEVDLARLEGVLNRGDMPPLRYLALHWDAAISPRDRADLHRWIYAQRAERRKEAGVLYGASPMALTGEPVEPLPNTVSVNLQRAALGELLFHDKRLSADNTLSCASCHSLRTGGTDRAKSSTGIRGQIGPINSPTVFNATFNFHQFWDGRAASLEEQAGGPVNNPLEMGSNWKQVLAKLNQDPEMLRVFRERYPDGLTSNNIMDAIATFERTLVTPNSRFDRYLRGETNALSHAERRGYQLFKQNCASCHAGKNLGGLSYEVMGRKADYFSDRGGKMTDADNGRYNVTHRAEDRHRFKVPTLRNIAQTAPYFHDGSARTLDETVRKMGHYQAGKDFNNAEVADLAAFLKTLTGEYKGKPTQ